MVLIRCNNGARVFLNDAAIEGSALPVFDDGAGRALSEGAAGGRPDGGG